MGQQEFGDGIIIHALAMLGQKEESMRNAALAAAGLLGSLLATAHAGFVVDFEDVGLPPDTFYNGADFAGGFFSRGAELGNSFDNSQGFDYWNGFAASSKNDPTTPGFGNQYAAASGPGVDGSLTYGVGFDDQYGPSDDTITLPAPATLAGLFVNNTAYAAHAMLQGDAFAKRFGGAGGTDPDWFMLRLRGATSGDRPRAVWTCIWPTTEMPTRALTTC